jgi:hypothetical protein
VFGLTDDDLQEIEKEVVIVLTGHKKVLKTMADALNGLGLANLNKIHHSRKILATQNRGTKTSNATTSKSVLQTQTSMLHTLLSDWWMRKHTGKKVRQKPNCGERDCQAAYVSNCAMRTRRMSTW